MCVRDVDESNHVHADIQCQKKNQYQWRHLCTGIKSLEPYAYYRKPY